MSRRLSARDFLAKSEWEGGLADLLMNYGMGIESVPEEIVPLWERAQHLSSRLERIFDEIMEVVEALDHEEYLHDHE